MLDKRYFLVCRKSVKSFNGNMAVMPKYRSKQYSHIFELMISANDVSSKKIPNFSSKIRLEDSVTECKAEKIFYFSTVLNLT